MPANIGPKIGVEGYSEYKRQMDEINQKTKQYAAQIEALTAAYDGNTDSLEYLQKKQALLKKQVDLQNQAVDEQKKHLQQVEKEIGNKADITDRERLVIEKTKTAQEVQNATLAKAQAEYNKCSQAVDNFGKETAETGQQTEQVTNKVTAGTVAIGNLMAKLVQWGASALKSVSDTGIGFNRQIETYKAAFSTLMGSEGAASSALKQIAQDAKNAPIFSLDGLIKSNQMIIATGESAESSRNAIMALANAVAASGGGNDELTRMAQNLQQIKNVGKASALDMRQFAYSGIDVYGLLAEYTGKSAAEVAKLDVTYEQLTGALQYAASAGGRYFGGLENQAKTLNGQMSALSNNVRSKLGEAFEGVSNTLKNSIIPALNKLVSSEDFVPGIKGAITAIGVFNGLLAITDKLYGSTGAKAKKAILEIVANTGAASIEQAALNGQLTASQILYARLTGNISKATAAQTLFNGVLAAAPYAAIAIALGGMVSAIASFNRDVKNRVDEYIIPEPKNIEEVTKHLDSLRAQAQEIEEVWPEFRTQEQTKNLEALNKAIKATIEQKAELQEELEYEASDEGQFNKILNNTKDQLTVLWQSYNEIYAASLEAAQKEFGLFEQVQALTYTSTENMKAALDSQIIYWENYRTNLELVSDAQSGLSEELLYFLSNGSQESAGYLQSIVNDVMAAGGFTSEKGQQIIQDLNNKFSQVQQSQKDYADASAESITNIGEEISKTVDNTLEAIKKLDVSEQTRQKGIDDMRAFADGFASQSEALNQAAYGIGKDIASSLQSGINSVQVSLPSFGGSYRGGGRPSWFHPHKDGLDYVPYDNYLAALHKGERVLTAAENKSYTNNNADNRRTTNVVIQKLSISGGADVAAARKTAQTFGKMLQQELDQREAVYR